LLEKFDRNEVLRKIYEAGVVGAGGAGFPTHKKLDCNVEFLIINAIECEPLLQTDKYIMRSKADNLIKAIMIVSEVVNAKNTLIAIKKDYKVEYKNLEEAAKKINANIEFAFFESFYPAGDEHILVYEITKRIVPPGGIPLQVGVVVSNIGTILNIYNAIFENKPVTRKYVSILGETKQPIILDVPIGISVKECINFIEEINLENFSIIIGGPMMGLVLNSEEVLKRSITKTDSAIIIIPSKHFLVNHASQKLEHIINKAKSSCIQCSYCTELCPRYLLGHPIRPHKVMRKIAYSNEIDNSFIDSLICSECGICELYACPMGLSPRLVNKYIKEELKKKNINFFYSQEKMIEPIKEREFRKIPTNRLLGRLNLDNYTIKGEIKIKKLDSEKVVIPLKQHIGKKAMPIVILGDVVKEGDIIAKVEYGEIGANVHSSIDGIVVNIDENNIYINKKAVR